MEREKGDSYNTIISMLKSRYFMESMNYQAYSTEEELKKRYGTKEDGSTILMKIVSHRKRRQKPLTKLFELILDNVKGIDFSLKNKDSLTLEDVIKSSKKHTKLKKDLPKYIEKYKQEQKREISQSKIPDRQQLRQQRERALNLGMLSSRTSIVNGGGGVDSASTSTKASPSIVPTSAPSATSKKK